ncbi:MAG: DUF3847 domain-containing protein [Oscillospiraceae bacterium]|nr:DUF3847 domain-containing protein [Oscillospiraceae bacterium]
MATAQKLAEQIEAAEKEIREKENSLKELRQKHKEQDSKERSLRRRDRGEILENLIEASETLTDGQIKTFLEKTIKTDFALKILTEIKEQNGGATGVKSETANKPED